MQSDIDLEVKTKAIKIISFFSLAVVTAILAVTTVGVNAGWPTSVYTSWPMVCLWAFTAIAALAYMLRVHLYRKPAVFGIHAAFLLILAGALCTHLTATEETLHLRVGERSPEAGATLASFNVIPYPGTDVPKDFVCTLRDESGETAEASMNRPASCGGWKYVIVSFDDDRGGVTLSASRDPWGKGLSYAGYILLALSFIGWFLTPGTSWRKALARLGTVVLLLFPNTAKAADIDSGFASEFGTVPVLYNGRICPMSTLARDFTVRLTGGSASFDRKNPDEVLAGFLFDFYDWKRIPIIRLNNKELQKLIGKDGKYVSYEDFFNAVTSGIIDTEDMSARKRYAKEIDRFEAINMLVSGELLKIFPVRNKNGGIGWYSTIGDLPSDLDGDRWIFIRKYLGLLNEQVQRGDAAEQTLLLEALRKYQRKELGDTLPPEWMMRTERVYNALSAMRWPPIAIGILGIGLFIAGLLSRRGLAQKVAMAATILSFAWYTFLIVMRWVVSGHVPMSNGYETMTLLAWLLLLTGLFFYRMRLMPAMCLTASALAAGVAAMSGAGSSVTGMTPVLDSPLLSVHVLLVMASYALFLLMAIAGIAGLTVKRESERMSSLALAMLYPAVALLATGIFTGAVWADMSWGRYWGWDPKEVWALVTMLIYSFPLHQRLFPALRSTRGILTYSAVAFLSVLTTYFGVNFFLGGLHSYA